MVQQISSFGPRRSGFGDRAWAAVAGLFERPEPVELIEQRFHFLPQRFRWRGDLRRVRAIALVWERSGTRRHAPRRYFRVICHDGRGVTLFQDLRIGTWHAVGAGDRVGTPSLP